MKIAKTKFKGLLLIKGIRFFDTRGYFREIFKNKNFPKKNFVFWCMSKSKKNVLRGLHLQKKDQQEKFISVVKGKILDVVIDLRKNSKTFKKVFKIILSKENAQGLFIPAGFAHAYYSFDKENIIYYKLDNYYAPKYESGIIFNDKTLKIKWPKKKLIISAKDKKLQTLNDFIKKYKSL